MRETVFMSIFGDRLFMSPHRTMFSVVKAKTVENNHHGRAYSFLLMCLVDRCMTCDWIYCIVRKYEHTYSGICPIPIKLLKYPDLSIEKAVSSCLKLYWSWYMNDWTFAQTKFICLFHIDFDFSIILYLMLSWRECKDARCIRMSINWFRRQGNALQP